MAKKPKKKLSAYNRHVQREMKAGKSMKQAAASWSKKSGKPKTKAKGSSKRSKPKGGNRTVSKNGFNTQKMYKYLRLAALALPAVQIAVTPGDPGNKVKDAMKAYTGWNSYTNKFELGALLQGWGPLLGATLATYGIPKLAGMLRSF